MDDINGSICFKRCFNFFFFYEFEDSITIFTLMMSMGFDTVNKYILFFYLILYTFQGEIIGKTLLHCGFLRLFQQADNKEKDV